MMVINIPPIVAVDAMTLVWGIRRQGTEQQCRKARWLFDVFTARKTQVIVPTVALSEYLTAVDPAHHEAVIDAMNKRFLIRAFTTECAPIAATLFAAGTQLRAKGVPGGRAVLRADSLIIATARIHGAGCLYSNDSDCRDLANTISPNFGQDVPDPVLDLYGNPIVE